MPDRCDLCGAPGDNCQSLFDRALSLEFTDPDYWAVHHLTVAAWMVQHDRYTHAGWLATRRLLAEFVASELPPGETGRRLARDAASRDGSLTRGAPFARFREIRWTTTVADLTWNDAEAYRATVRRWARAVLADSAAAAEAAENGPQP
jgi:hypothetical protein